MARNFTAEELRQCAEREVKLRRQVYPNRVECGRMTQQLADRQIAMMQAIAERLRADEQTERLL